MSRNVPDIGGLSRDVVSGAEHARMVGQRDAFATRAAELLHARDDARIDRDRWVRAFNRLDAAINHHDRDTSNAFCSDADERLWAARERITRDLHQGTV